MDYIEGLSKEERQLYTERLIKLHNILAADTTTEYKHEVWVEITKHGLWKRIRTGQHCGTAACAMGHALLHRNEFPGLEASDYRPYLEILGGNAPDIAPLVPTSESFHYFGPDSYKHIFAAGAYDKDPEAVTRTEAMQRIEEYITVGLGCQLIEDDSHARGR